MAPPAPLEQMVRQVPQVLPVPTVLLVPQERMAPPAPLEQMERLVP